jgi:hypothetical protein
MYSTTTASSSPLASPTFNEQSFPDYPGSPSLSTTTDSSSGSRYSYRLSFGEPAVADHGLGLYRWGLDVSSSQEQEGPSSASIDASLRALNLNSRNNASNKRNATYFGSSLQTPGFQSYSLPTEDFDSVSTPRKLSETSDAKTSDLGTGSSAPALDLTLPTTERSSTLEEMLSELGYLGDAIVPS